MSKTPEDYRNIVKILKLQLLKVRQENATLSHQMGIISDSETSSFTPKLNHYRQSEQAFSQKVALFLEFAHRCELVGICPEMVFRIADKKRDKSVNSKNLGEVMKRLKLRMSDEQINKLVGILARSGSSIEYDDYLECLSAFQINSQKYPATASRTYVQLCLLEFAKVCKEKYPQCRKLFAEIAQSNESYFKYDNFANFCMRECKLNDVQIVAIFLGLDIQSLCRIQREIFERQLEKIYSLIDRGLVDQKSLIQERAKRSPTKNPTEKRDDEINDFADDAEQVGDQAFTKKKKEPIQQKPKQKASGIAVANKLDKKISKNIVLTLQKLKTSYGEFIQRLIEKEESKKDIYYRSFSFNEFKGAILATGGDFSKTGNIMNIFKQLDLGRNGSISTEQLIKIFLRNEIDHINDYLPSLYNLFYRHLKEIQFPEPSTKFTTLSYKLTDQISQKNIKDVFQKLNLDDQEIRFFCGIVGTITIQKFCQYLKKKPSIPKARKFQPMSQDDSKILSDFMNKAKPEKESNSQFKKLIRNPEDKGEDQSEIWQTIFENELDCFRYCFEQASKLKTFWRDHQFGPTKGDPNGLRAIIGNESKRPPCLPDDEDILWMNHEQMIKIRKLKGDPVFWNKQLKSTDVVQGKLGDCWYVSALSTITLNDEYIKGKPISRCKQFSDLTYGIMPPLFRCFSKYGMYVFKFFKKFKPVYVIIDDLLPVQKSSNELIFAKSPEQNMQWVSFSQKSYAKLHHTYSNMISGDIAQGLNDLTNSLPIKQVLTKGTEEDKLNNINNIKNLNKKRQLMGCSIKIPKEEKGDSVAEPPFEYNERRCGLLGGHAYSIIDCLSVHLDKDDYDLIRVRNPWGNSEWLLEWSDTPLDDDPDCQQLKKHQKDIDKYYSKFEDGANPGPYKPGEDGQFLMPINDWGEIFSNLFIGLNEGYQLAKRQFYLTEDIWGGKKPSGVCKSKGAKDQATEFVKNNHQYIMQISQTTEVLMLLSQEDGRLYRGQTYPYKEIVKSSIILVFDLNGQKTLSTYDKKKFVDPNRALTMEARRDVSYWRTYEKGRYAIIPCRNEKSDKENKFQFRVYSNKNIKLSKKDQIQSGFKKMQNKISSVNVDKTSIDKIVKFLEKNDFN